MTDPLAIDRPEKIGLGVYPSHGLSRLFADVDLLDLAWFYAWTPTLPEFGIESWSFGGRLRAVDGGGDVEAAIGAGGWLLQSVAADGGDVLDLRVGAVAGAASSGGAAVDFHDAAGRKIGGGWTPLGASSGPAAVNGLVAPAGTAEARVILWGDRGELRVDDVGLFADGRDLLANGGFERTAWASDVRAAFVPMAWGRADVAAGLGQLKETEVLLGFNEPDSRLQANLSVDAAIALWPTLEATGARLGSPAPMTPGTLGANSWLSRFMTRADAEGLRVDFVAVHYYSSNQNVGAFKSFLEKTHAAYGRPIWVTEWGLVDWANHDRFSFEQTARFLREGALMMDELDFVERHAWFGAYDGLDGLSLNAHAFDDAGDLTPVGRVFAEFSPGRSIVGGAGADRLIGGAGDDVIQGRGGADVLFGGLGDDRFAGGGGGDVFDLGEVRRYDAGRDVVADFTLAGGGMDTLVFQWADGERRLSTPQDFARFVAMLGADGDASTGAAVAAGALRLAFGAGRGSVELAGVGRDATVAAAVAAAGRDEAPPAGLTLIGGSGADTLVGGDGDDVIDGRGGDDVIRPGLGDDRMTGGGSDSNRYELGEVAARDAGDDVILDFDLDGGGETTFDTLTLSLHGDAQIVRTARDLASLVWALGADDDPASGAARAGADLTLWFGEAGGSLRLVGVGSDPDFVSSAWV